MEFLRLEDFIKTKKSRKIFYYYIFRFLRNNKTLDFRNNVACFKHKESSKWEIMTDKNKTKEFIHKNIIKFRTKSAWRYFASGNGNFKEFKYSDNFTFKEFFEQNKDVYLFTYLYYNA